MHTGVWERADAGPVVTAARVPRSCAQGTYHVLDEHGAVVSTVEVHGGSVATVDLRELTPPPSNLHVPPTFWGRSVSDPDTDLPQMWDSVDL